MLFAAVVHQLVLETLNLHSFELGLGAQIILNLDGLSNSIVYGGLCRRQSFEQDDEQLPRGRTFPADSVSSPSNESFDDFLKKRGGNQQFGDDLDLTMMTSAHETGTTTTSLETGSSRTQQCLFSTGADDILMRSSILNCLPHMMESQRKSLWSHHQQQQHATRKASYENLQQNRKATTMRPKKLPLFVSTFNMGEQNVNEKELVSCSFVVCVTPFCAYVEPICACCCAKLTSLVCLFACFLFNKANWIPLGYQVYVIGVQECMDLADLQTKIHHHLVVGSQCKFVYYSREIGKRATALGYHGYIALTVFVRENAVLEGRFQMPYRQSSNKSAQEVYRGKSLLVFGRASNKGAVGMSFRYENTSFAFATCHLASDSSTNRLSKRRKSRESKNTPASKFERRNQDAMQILQQLYLDDEDYGFGFPLLHHHSFILGDFNYRMTRRNANPQEMLELFTQVGVANALAAAARHSNGVIDVVIPLPSSLPSVLSSDETIDSPTNSYDFQQCVTPKLEREIQTTTPTSTASTATLMSLVEDHDELRALLNSKQLFYGFQEPPVDFYPTFRRIRGEQLNSEDPQSFLKNFTLITSKGGYRIPSYTDRVLHSSLPGSQDMIECIAYSSCESVTTSDHKPVFGIFQVTLNEPVLDQKNVASVLSPRHPLSPYAVDDSLWTNSGGGHLNILNSATTSAVAAGRMKDVPGTCEMRLKIDFRSIHWMDAIDCQPGSTLFDRVEDIEFGFLFPIPCEDVFSQQRKLHEVAEHLTWMDSGGGSKGGGGNGNGGADFASTVTPTSNFHTIKWNNFVEGGLRYNTMAQPSGKKHVAILIRAQSRGRVMSRTSSATAMLGSPFVQPDSCSASSGGNDMGSGQSRILTTVPTASEQILGQGTFCVDATGKKSETSISLTVGGKLLGRLQLQVALQVRRHQR